MQPDLKTRLTLTQETPVPTVVIWSPKNGPAKTIIAPLPAKATAADVRPSMNPPNEEINLADFSISAADRANARQDILPSTTSPVVVLRPELAQTVPVTASQASAQPTPTAVMSLSDLRMREGSVALPPVNETASTSSPGEMAMGLAGNGRTAISNNGDERQSGAVKQIGTEKQSGAKAGSSQSKESNPGPGSEPTTTQITLGKNGQFGAVVVGNSLENKYPEVAQIWSGRLAYTVYLHVGTAKSWILQYSLPRSADAVAAGNITRMEAPWPYNIVRPNLAPGALNADALMVHGFVNKAGRFETLAIVFPPEFEQGPFVLNALAQWEFRAAGRDGQAERVEVLLIIPEEPE